MLNTRTVRLDEVDESAHAVSVYRVASYTPDLRIASRVVVKI